MKTNLICTAAFLAGICALQGCQKDPMNDLTGTYTYKTSGTVTVETRAENPEEKRTYTLNLANEEGQMTLVGQTSVKLFVACNAIGGEAYTFTLLRDENENLEITGSPNKAVSVKSSSLPVGSGNVTFGGSGKLYDDVLSFNCKYTGVITIAGTEMDITGSDVEIVAKKN